MAASMLEQISARAACTPQQAEEAVAEALRLLNLSSVEDPMASTGMLLACRGAFGLPACFHLANIILGWIDNHDDRLMLTETMLRLGGLELREISERWNRELSERNTEPDASSSPSVPDPRFAGRLEMKSTDLINALRALSAAQKRWSQLTVSFNSRDLEIARGVTRVGVPAVGNWPRVAVAGVRLIKDLLKLRAA